MKKLTLHQVVWYFCIFSIIGMLMENTVCLIFSGNIESRKGFLIGPFCPIYGIGALILIFFLAENKDKWYKVLFGGMFIGASFEYISSYAMQALYGIKFWDYQKYFLNLNGRTAAIYAICWGILSLILIYLAEPTFEKFIKAYKSKPLDIIIATFMVINCFATYKALDLYVIRADEKLKGKNHITQNGFEELLSDEVMKYNFPNIIYIQRNNNQTKLKDLS